MGRELTYSVYRCTSPSGKSYVGYTSQSVQRRWGQHVTRSKTKARHPFYAAIRKYGPDKFTVQTIYTAVNRVDALAEEVRVIAQTEPTYNVSLGGEDDSAAGVSELKRLFNDPEWFATYRLRLSESVKASDAHRDRWPLLTELAAEWRRTNVKKAYKISRRACRVAANSARGAERKTRVEYTEDLRQKMSAAQKVRWEAAPPSVKKKKSMVSRRVTTEVWAARDAETKAAIAKKISDKTKKIHAEQSETERAERMSQLAQARKNIDHEYRKQRQREALAAYWTPERRAEKAAKMKAIRQKKLGGGDANV